ncbi:hypothetical protein BV22DRAFT_725214 [Leucogyrophana mollusca]|uniref:Uncharacterized protein n=1 Tax=Leucogyrophana mollusca TaxID=85980 RepID=A0ACB8B6V6_9AGAM|nr:hypothetical protein BV22DRAFT_725214 [Leucogyrophana mollusca]
MLPYLEGLRESPTSTGFPNLALPSVKQSAPGADEEDGDDLDSNVQEGEMSVGPQSTGMPNLNNTPLTEAKIPLPMSVASPRSQSFHINVEPPSTPSGSKSRRSPSQVPTSPRSHRHEPGLPPSESPSQPPLKATTNAAKKVKSVVSVASEVEVAASKRGGPMSTAGSPMSPSHHNPPFSPYRHPASHEDLLFAATSAAHMQKQSSIVNAGGSEASHVSHQSHHSHHSQARVEKDPEATPTPSHPNSPSFSLNQAEEEIVAAAFASRDARDRTSYAPSTLELEIVNSHFHDKDLCVLLHQMADVQTQEGVKRALRKAVRQRAKTLGLKYNQEYRKPFHDHDSSVHLDAEFDSYDSHFHDMDLCILLHQMDDPQIHEVVKTALRESVRQRVKILGVKYDQEQYRKPLHDHNPSVPLDNGERTSYAPVGILACTRPSALTT